MRTEEEIILETKLKAYNITAAIKFGFFGSSDKEILSNARDYLKNENNLADKEQKELYGNKK